jgi:putative redox protein
MDDWFDGDGLRLSCHLAVPATVARAGGPVGAVVVCHGFPTGAGGSRTSAATFPELADRIASQTNCSALTFNFRGCGRSEGDFSLAGWLTDLRSAVDHVRERVGARDVWLVGASTGASLAIAAAAADQQIRGVAALAARADFDDWASHPRRLLEHARDIGVIRSAGYPQSFEAWARELREVRPVELAGKLPPRPMLLVHGSEDEYVPVADARVLADAHGECDLRLVGGAGHRLRHDPRAIAILLGWLERETAGSGHH